MASGFFGKLPASGDFIARGLPTGLQSYIDRWLTRHVAEYARNPELWPTTGIRALLPSPHGGSFALLILPSQDAPGRKFPLAIFSDATAADQEQIDDWADKMLPIANCAIRDTQSADQLQSVLANAISPTAAETPLHPPLIWSTGAPADPAIALRLIFSSG